MLQLIKSIDKSNIIKPLQYKKDLIKKTPNYVKKNKIVNYEDINILIDDYSKNILEWGESKNFIGIKMINNINDTNKEWSNQNKPFMFYNSDIKIKIGLLNNIVSSIRLF